MFSAAFVGTWRKLIQNKMGNFKEALKLMKEGKKVKRESWLRNIYMCWDKTLDEFKSEDGSLKQFWMMDFDATDWEVNKK